MHVGDMIHPVPEAVSYPDAVARFREATADLDASLYLVPGNHDVGDKQADYVPAGAIRPEYLALYEKHFGRHYFSFDVEDCHFVVINTSLVNSALPQEQAQADWLEEDLRNARGKRVFLFVHYPPYIAGETEHGHYDNIDEPGRSWLLELCARFGVTAMFTGHVHNFFFNAHEGMHIYSMPSTSFVRGDYSELFAITPTPELENGRNDVSKLGLLLMDVYEDRVVPQFIRTFDQADGRPARPQRDWPRLPPAAGALPTVGIDLRYSWTEMHDIPYSSMLDEFRRKQARNDYPILALWEMGIRRLRVPLDDLTQPASLARMRAMAAQGASFTVFHFGWPSLTQQRAIAGHRALLAAFEIVLKWPLDAKLADQLAALKAALKLPLHVSRFWSASGQSRDGKQIKLLVDHGFSGADDPAIGELAAQGVAGRVDALVFRVSSSRPARLGIEEAVRASQRHGLAAQVHVRLAADSPAQSRHDVHANGMRMLEAALCAHFYREHAVFIDTLSDVDRGYFPRAGLVDGRFNPRPSGQMLRNLNGALSEAPRLTSLEWHESPGWTIGLARTGNGAGTGAMALLLPTSDAAAAALPHIPGNPAVQSMLDLATGQAYRAGGCALLVTCAPSGA
jgi:hypothetical protein